MAYQDDDRLMARFKGGDVAAFEALYERYHRLVYSYALQLLQDVHRAEDALQDTFLRAGRDAATYRPEGAFIAWLMAICRNRCLSTLRRETTRQRLMAETGLALLPQTSGPTPAARYAAGERLALVEQALQKLPAGQREAVMLHAIDGLRYRDIAGILNVSLSTVKVWIHRGRAGLIRSLEGEEQGP